MDEDLIRSMRRWWEADGEGHDEDADTACRAVFAEAGTDRAIPLDFASRTMDAIEAAAAEDSRQARRMRRAVVGGGVLGGAAAAYFGGPWAVAALSSLVIGVLDLLVGATIRVVSGVQAGADAWTLVSSMGRAIAAFVSDPTVTVAMLAMQGIAIGALFALQRLLGTDRESLE
jgi:hypothetical protein